MCMSTVQAMAMQAKRFQLEKGKRLAHISNDVYSTANYPGTTFNSYVGVGKYYQQNVHVKQLMFQCEMQGNNLKYNMATIVSH